LRPQTVFQSIQPHDTCKFQYLRLSISYPLRLASSELRSSEPSFFFSLFPIDQSVSCDSCSMDCLRYPTVESTQFISFLYRIAYSPFGAHIHFNHRPFTINPLCCQYDFLLSLFTNTVHETKLNINHIVCSEVWTYYKHISAGLHKRPSFSLASTLRYNRRSEHRTSIFKDRNSCNMNLAVFSFPPFLKRTKEKVLIIISSMCRSTP
jgi:hypothetical protein